MVENTPIQFSVSSENHSDNRRYFSTVRAVVTGGGIAYLSQGRNKTGMAYRRRQGMARSSTFKEETHTSCASLATHTIRASSSFAHRDSSNSKGHGTNYDYTSMDSSNGVGGFWDSLARKAKAILEEDNAPHVFEEWHQPRTQQIESSKKMDKPEIQNEFNVFTPSVNRIGGTTGKEEHGTIADKKTGDLIQESRQLQIGGRNGINSEDQGGRKLTQSQNQTSQEDMLKASRDVAMATAAKAKLLLRELKTIKADLAFAKQRCSQLEEENKILRDAREKGVNPADDDMIRLQLETLLAEKARLANENSVYARENRFLREIVEYHQLTMQDIVYLDEGIEEVTEVHPVSLTLSESSPISRSRSCVSLLLTEEVVSANKETGEANRG